LIQNSQETEEALEELKQTIELTKTKMWEFSGWRITLVVEATDINPVSHLL
jgi:hypothetical protein